MARAWSSSGGGPGERQRPPRSASGAPAGEGGPSSYHVSGMTVPTLHRTAAAFSITARRAAHPVPDPPRRSAPRPFPVERAPSSQSMAHRGVRSFVATPGGCSSASLRAARDHVRGSLLRASSASGQIAGTSSMPPSRLSTLIRPWKRLPRAAARRPERASAS
jgi:hypothetical protein